jgi:hypothetical protein
VGLVGSSRGFLGVGLASGHPIRHDAASDQRGYAGYTISTCDTGSTRTRCSARNQPQLALGLEPRAGLQSRRYRSH